MSRVCDLLGSQPKKKLLTPFLLAFSLLLTSCGDSPESVADDAKDLQAELFDIVKGVNEGDDIDAAVEDFKELAERITILVKEEFDDDRKAFEKKMEELTEDEDFEKEFEAEMKKLMTSGSDKAMKISMAIMDVMKEVTPSK